MNKNDKDFLGTAPIGKLLLSLALPTITAQLINMLYNIVDRIYIGHIPEAGALALTGVGVCMPLILIVSAFAALVGSGGAPRASILMGKQEHDQAEQILGNCFALLFLISIVLTVILLAWNRPILLAFGASENTISYATDYMNIYAIGTIFVQMTLGMNMFITTQGYAKTGMLSVLIGAVINIILDPIFIFAMGMGVKGGALATVISQAVSCVWVISFLCGKKTQLQLKVSNMKMKKSVILPVLPWAPLRLSCRPARASFPSALTRLCYKIRRRCGSRRYDHPDQCHAVCHAANARDRTGCSADHELQLWRRKDRPCKEGVLAVIKGHLRLLYPDLAGCDDLPTGICGAVHL